VSNSGASRKEPLARGAYRDCPERQVDIVIHLFLPIARKKCINLHFFSDLSYVVRIDEKVKRRLDFVNIFHYKQIIMKKHYAHNSTGMGVKAAEILNSAVGLGGGIPNMYAAMLRLGITPEWGLELDPSTHGMYDGEKKKLLINPNMLDRDAPYEPEIVAVHELAHIYFDSIGVLAPEYVSFRIDNAIYLMNEINARVCEVEAYKLAPERFPKFGATYSKRIKRMETWDPTSFFTFIFWEETAIEYAEDSFQYYLRLEKKPEFEEYRKKTFDLYQGRPRALEYMEMKSAKAKLDALMQSPVSGRWIFLPSSERSYIGVANTFFKGIKPDLVFKDFYGKENYDYRKSLWHQATALYRQSKSMGD
jgi:hypothetical protein